MQARITLLLHNSQYYGLFTGKMTYNNLANLLDIIGRQNLNTVLVDFSHTTLTHTISHT